LGQSLEKKRCCSLVVATKSIEGRERHGVPNLVQAAVDRAAQLLSAALATHPRNLPKARTRLDVSHEGSLA
jgi:hypothetical protein